MRPCRRCWHSRRHPSPPAPRDRCAPGWAEWPGSRTGRRRVRKAVRPMTKRGQVDAHVHRFHHRSCGRGLLRSLGLFLRELRCVAPLGAGGLAGGATRPLSPSRRSGEELGITSSCRPTCSEEECRPKSKRAGLLVLFFHQCESEPDSTVTSPALCSIGTAQVLRYSVTAPDTTRMLAGRSRMAVPGNDAAGLNDEAAHAKQDGPRSHRL